jgi:DNA polymerase-3 subunit gamma/tau
LQHLASAGSAENAHTPKPTMGEAAIVSTSAAASASTSGEANVAPAPTAADVTDVPALAPWQEETSIEPILSDPVPAATDTNALRAAPTPEATPPAPATEAAEATKVAAAPALAPWDDAPTEPAPNESPAAAASQESAPASSPTAAATAAFARAEEAAPATASQEPPPAADIPPRRAGGASDALNVLRSAGLKVSSDRGRATSAAAARPAVAPAAPKPAAPRVVVNVPTPGAPRRAPQQDAAPAARAPSPQAQEQNGSSSAPWDDMPPDEYMPLTAADEGYYGLPDDNYMPVFDSGPDDVRVNAAPASTSAPAVDKQPLPPAVPLDPLGFQGDWPALAVDLPLKGISYQLAFNSELMALEGSTLKLSVPVPQYAEASQVAKLKAALADKLGQNVDVLVEVGPARRTAAAHDAAMRAQRQQEAEREIGADPFVQSLIREFGASIVPGSIRPITQDAGPNGAPSVH